LTVAREDTWAPVEKKSRPGEGRIKVGRYREKQDQEKKELGGTLKGKDE